MSEQTRIIIILVLCFILLAVISIYVSTLMFKSALRQVLKMFRDHEALTSEKAMFADELGMKSVGFIRFGTFRDYKPNAMDFLIKQDIVKVTDEGKLFLSEEDMVRSGFEHKINPRKQ